MITEGCKLIFEQMLDSHRGYMRSPVVDRGAYAEFSAQQLLSACLDAEGVHVMLKDFDFTNRELRCADFSDVNVSDVDFTGSHLFASTFEGSLATRAVFEDTDCHSVIFRHCNMPKVRFNRNTNLYRAELHMATGPFVTGYFGMHNALAYADVALIGWRKLPIDDWLKDGRRIFKDDGYSKVEIDAYMSWLRTARKVLESMNEWREVSK